MKKGMRKTLLFIVAVLVGIACGIGIRNLMESYSLPTDWYTSYTYTKDDTNNTITLTKYNGTDTEVVVPSKVTMDDQEYQVIINGEVYSGNTNITKVTFENGVKAGESLRMLFYSCTNLEEIIFNDFDTSNVKNMHGVFARCYNLRHLDVSSFDTSNVTTMNAMFIFLEKLTELDVSNFNTSKVTDMQRMFEGLKLEEIDVSNFDTSNVIVMNGMFYDCKNLKRLDISSFNTRKVNSFQDMLLYDDNLSEIKLGKDCVFKRTNGQSIARGTWKKVEDNKEYSFVDVAYRSQNEDVSGTYHKVSNIISELFPDFLATYRINDLNNISKFETTNTNMFEKMDERTILLKNLTVASTDDYLVPGEVTVTYNDAASDANDNKYNVRLTFDNIHIYDINTDEGHDNFGIMIFGEDARFSDYIYPYADGKLILGDVEAERDFNRIYTNSPVKYDVLVEITDKNGNPLEGSFVFTAYDLDIPSIRDGQNGSKGFGNYSEGINLISGFDEDTIKIYEHSFLTKNNNRITGSLGDGGTEMSEFIIRGKSDGLKFAWTGAGGSKTNVLSGYQPQIVELVKQDKNGNKVPGAKLELYSDNKKITEWTTTNENKKLFLMPGRYILKEVSAPNHYEKANDIEFFVDYDGTLKVDGNTVSKIVMTDNYKKYPYVINYIDKSNNNKRMDTKNGEEEYNKIINGNDHKKDFTGYIYDSMDKESITITDDGTKNIINIYYKKISGGVVEKHLDEYNNNILGDEVEYKGNVGDRYSTSSKNFEGYVLSRTPSNASGAMKDELIEVIYYYKKQSKVIIKYIDEETGEEISKEIEKDGFVGDDYTSEDKKIPGYKLVVEPKNKNGKLGLENEEVFYYYRKVANVITKVNGTGGRIVGDEEVFIGNNSTPGRITVTPDKNHFIKKITINGEEIEITNENGMTLDYFVNMQEDKVIEVTFGDKVGVPKTDMNSILPIIAGIILVIGIGLLVFSKKIFKG